MLHVALALINMGKVCSIVQRDPLDVPDVVKKRLHGYVLSLILYAVDQKGGDFDFGQLGYAGPIAK